MSTSSSNGNVDPETAIRLREENRKRALDRLKATKERLANERSNVSQDKGKEKEKRPLDSISTTNASSQHRDASKIGPLQPEKKFKNYVDYDFSKMKDTHGGFIADETEAQPQGMTLDEWKENQRLNQAPTFLDNPDAPKCFECKTPVLDFKIYNLFKCRVCKDCMKKYPEKYSLLTKTECREDYLLTDRKLLNRKTFIMIFTNISAELRDEELLPHMERPNPHKNTYTNMMLYLRYQVEEFSYKKWGSPEALDAEYERREAAKKVRKEKKFLDKLKEMRKKTRAEAITKHTDQRHKHEWSAPTAGLNGMTSRRCGICGMTTEEIVF